VKFIDEVIITVQSGNGGKGCVSFRREPFVPRGGPDGGDGGQGGSVILSSTSRQHSLYQFRFKKHFKAQNGGSGKGKQQTGKNGNDLLIEIPPGTLVTDINTGNILKDFDKPGENWTVAKGGMGGRGNRWFKSSTHRAPKSAQPGEPGKTVALKLELKLIADVGIIGLPNAGKSTLISKMSSAHPEIGDYPFTTLTPILGVVQMTTDEPFVVADIPGLIQGAHKGSGLGIRFLRHIERTRVLIHLIDGATISPENPLRAYNTINHELAMYSETLGNKTQLVVINKKDLSETRDGMNQFMARAQDIKVLCISALTGEGVSELISEIRNLLDRIDSRVSV
jgi:GTP-binding protein